MSGVVGFVGLDSFSFELASSLLRSGFKVQAFEVCCFFFFFFFFFFWGSACSGNIILIGVQLFGIKHVKFVGSVVISKYSVYLSGIQLFYWFISIIHYTREIDLISSVEFLLIFFALSIGKNKEGS